MKHFLLFFILIGFKTFSQPPETIAESNYFTYHKYNYGQDIQNPSKGVIDQKGRFWIKPYIGKYYIVENSKIKELNLPGLQDLPEIEALFTVDGRDYLCTQGNIFVFKNDTLVQNIRLTQKQETAENFILHQNKIFYTVHHRFDEITTGKAQYFDFKKNYKIFEQTEKTSHNLSLFKIKNQLYLNSVSGLTSTVFEVNDRKLKKIHSIKFTTDKNSNIQYQNSVRNYKVFYQDAKKIETFTNHKLVKTESFPKDYYFHTDHFFLINSNQTQGVYPLSDLSKPLFNSFYNFNFTHLVQNKFTNSYFAGNGGQLIRFFPHIIKYPKLFNESNSAQVFTMAQTPDSKLWVGSYNGFLSTIENNQIVKATTKNLRFLNGNVTVGNKLLLFAEGYMGNYLFFSPSQYQKILDKHVFFYGYKAKSGKYYLGSMKAGLFELEPEYFDNFDEKYIHIKSLKDGMKLNNIITISEDRFGNIWMGQRGVAVYNPRKNKVTTWHSSDDPKFFSAMASLQDSYKTLWFGTSTGALAFFDGKNADDLKFENFKKIQHPLLKNNSHPISFLHQWKNFLVIGAVDRILLFDLEQWHRNKKISVRYLNPQEANFSAPTEQNTIITDKRDESIWFSTSDMVYQWDIKKWLKLPTFKVKPSLVITKDSIKKTFLPNQKISFEPTENSFDFEVSYQTLDNLPRYVNCILVKKGEKPEFDFPNLQTSFHYANLSSGDYVFYVRICQQDGSFELFEYPIYIDSFLWQKWWFWGLTSLIPLGFMFYYFRKKSEIEQAKKKLTQLNLASLSNQFRPHFMLNALNSIAAQMESMPNAEKVISRLGESINILYGFSQKNEFTHDFADEWKLVENFIEIQKILYLPELKLQIRDLKLIPKAYRVPVGLLQIPVENALLHGLRNKDFGDYHLKILFSEKTLFYEIEIEDNGIGREKASGIHQIKKNGKGLKTIFDMIDIINQYTSDSISLKIIDLENNEGTKIAIKLRKNTDYGKIKL